MLMLRLRARYPLPFFLLIAPRASLPCAARVCAGTWYIGLKALPGETATYTMRLSLKQPAAASKPEAPYCSGLTRFCASSTQRFATVDKPLTTAADTRVPGALQSSARSSLRRSSRWASLTAMACSATTVAAMLLPFM